ncbi:MAG: right-handed parallel beta-helix repeat-containing protein [Planctomycetota bacterium]|mgnify:CR=1 FL=1
MTPQSQQRHQATTPCGDPASTLQLRVGGPDADIPGRNGRAIQFAIDAVAAHGGGTVLVAEGDYLLSDALRMRSGVAVIGRHGKTKLHRGPLVWSRLAVDADKSERQMTPADPAPWQIGMGVCLFDRLANNWVMANKPLSVVAIADGVCHFSDHLEKDVIAEAGSIAVNYFPMIIFDQADRASIHGFDIDAAVADPDQVLAGMRNHAVFIWRSQHVHVARLTVRNALYDGITTSSSSIGAVIEDCSVIDSGNFGIHPGSHSTDVVVRRCTISGSGADGLWVCWGIRRGRFLDNIITGNGARLHRSGICIGHKDTDAHFEGNHIYNNNKHGIAFRDETEANGAHRATIRNNIIENNGSRRAPQIPANEFPCSGIAIGALHRDVIIEGNTIRETRNGPEACQRHAVVIAKGSTVASLKDNTITGHPEAPIIDLAQT